MSGRNKVPNEPIKLFLPAEDTMLSTTVAVPAEPNGVVVLADGSNPMLFTEFARIAEFLQMKGYATVMADLLSSKEAHKGAGLRLLMPLLRKRVALLLSEISRRRQLNRLPIGLVCAGAAGAAALSLGMHDTRELNALVLIDAKTELAEHHLPWLSIPTLFLLSGADPRLAERTLAAGRAATQAPTKTVFLSRSDWCERLDDEILAWLDVNLPGDLGE